MISQSLRYQRSTASVVKVKPVKVLIVTIDQTRPLFIRAKNTKFGILLKNNDELCRPLHIT